jgi:hypothetical protein
MRDPARIPKVLAALQVAWEKSPDLRLGQLIVCLASPNCDVNKIFQLEEGSWIHECENWPRSTPDVGQRDGLMYWGTPYPKPGDRVGFLSSDVEDATERVGVVDVSAHGGRLCILGEDGSTYWPHAVDKWRKR